LELFGVASGKTFWDLNPDDRVVVRIKVVQRYIDDEPTWYQRRKENVKDAELASFRLFMINLLGQRMQTNWTNQAVKANAKRKPIEQVSQCDTCGTELVCPNCSSGVKRPRVEVCSPVCHTLTP
jgi:hypothetical protein